MLRWLWKPGARWYEKAIAGAALGGCLLCLGIIILAVYLNRQLPPGTPISKVIIIVPTITLITVGIVLVIPLKTRRDRIRNRIWVEPDTFPLIPDEELASFGIKRGQKPLVKILKEGDKENA